MFEKPHINHNVYILGAGFSFDSGIPLVNNFLTRMADSVEWLYDANRMVEAEAIQEVFKFRREAAGAAFRSQIDVDNIEELFSLSSAIDSRGLTQFITTAIAATIDFARSTAYEGNPFSKHTTHCIMKYLSLGGFDGLQATKVTKTKEDCYLYHLYADIISGRYCEEERGVENTIISFNYDTELEDAFIDLDIPFTYGFSPSSACYHDLAKCEIDEAKVGVQPIYKLHGSVNWGIDHSDTSRVHVFRNYNDLRATNKEVLLIPPTWRKVFGSHLTSIWSKTVNAIQNATRIIVIGFSMPPTDTHFKYLIAAGLQNNISLRKFIFVNPALNSNDGIQRSQLRDNLFKVLRSDLEEKGVIELVPTTTSGYFLSSDNREKIRRSVAPACSEIEYRDETYPKYHY
jgi:hypothetical protein